MSRTPDDGPARVLRPGDDLAECLRNADDGAVIAVSDGEWPGPFVVRRSLTLRGSGAARCALVGSGEGALLTVEGRGARVVLAGLTLRGGGETRAGGGVLVANGADLVVSAVVFADNRAAAFGGGALYLRRGRARLEDVAFDGNSGGQGGAILVDNDAELTVVRCQFRSNQAAHRGGAIAVCGRARVRIEDSVFADNRVDVSGGGAALHIGLAAGAPHGVEFVGGSMQPGDDAVVTASGGPTGRAGEANG